MPPANKRNFPISQSGKFLAILSEFGFVRQVNEIWFAVAYVDVTSFNEVFVIVVIVIVAAATDTAEPKIIMKTEKS